MYNFKNARKKNYEIRKFFVCFCFILDKEKMFREKVTIKSLETLKKVWVEGCIISKIRCNVWCDFY